MMLRESDLCGGGRGFQEERKWMVSEVGRGGYRRYVSYLRWGVLLLSRCFFEVRLMGTRSAC
jgi:hypothetical protein